MTHTKLATLWLLLMFIPILIVSIQKYFEWDNSYFVLWLLSLIIWLSLFREI